LLGFFAVFLLHGGYGLALALLPSAFEAGCLKSVDFGDVGGRD
jgi:hypothetical protein